MGTLVFQANLGGAVNLVGPNTASTVNFTLPSADGSSGQALVTNGSGTLSFSSFVSAAAGSNTQVQFNSSGAFAGSANLTFNGTTLTAANTSVTTSETLSYGTANGVAYLNGSKVVTTGSALTFDGTNFGLGVASPANYTNYRNLAISGTTGANIDLLSGATKVGNIFNDGTNFYLYNVTAGSVVFGQNNTEGMRLTSTGLGIGTSSPATKLDVRGELSVPSSTYSIRFYNTDRSNWSYISNTIGASSTDSNLVLGSGAGAVMTLDGNGRVGIGTSSPAVKLDVSGTGQSLFKLTTTNSEANINFNINGSTGNYFGITGGANFFWNTGATERMRLDSSGNLGLGVTPSAWDVYKGSQVLQGALASSANAANNTIVTSNAYYNAGYKYIAASETATMYQQATGAHSWHTTGTTTGTVGSAISFTQAMTLTASGNLGIGATNPSSKLEAYGEIRNSSPADSGNKTQARLTAYRDGSNWGYIGYGDDAIMRIVYAATVGSYPLLFGTTSGFDNTGTFTQTMAMNSSGLLILKGGADTAAAGIAFPATQVASSNANTLDDYEEGTWTPTTSTANLSVTTVSSAYYTKIGRQVTCYCYITITNSSGSNITSMQLDGLPFNSLGYGFAAQYYAPYVSGGATAGDKYIEAGTSYAGLNSMTLIPGGNPSMFYFSYFA